MPKVDVELPTALRDWVESRVEVGLYADASEYIRDLVRRDRTITDGDVKRLSEIDDRITQSLRDEEEGRVYEIDEVFDEIYAMIDAAEVKTAAE